MCVNTVVGKKYRNMHVSFIPISCIHITTNQQYNSNNIILLSARKKQFLTNGISPTAISLIHSIQGIVIYNKYCCMQIPNFTYKHMSFKRTKFSKIAHYCIGKIEFYQSNYVSQLGKKRRSAQCNKHSGYNLTMSTHDNVL